MSLQTPIAAALLAAVTLIQPADAQEAFRTGMVELSISDPDRPMDGFVWYPTEQADGLEPALGNAVWEPIRVIPGADPAHGLRPLVLLSHGMFGNARNQAWLAEALVAEGYIVAAIDHPGTSTFSRDPDQRRELWQRPRDISRLLDALLERDDIGALVDPERIYMAGHSLGGWTAVALAGGRFDAARMDATCAAIPDDLVCGIFGAWGVAVTPEDRAAMGRDLSDPRLAAIVSFDLGGTQFFSPDSHGTLEMPMLVIGAPVANSGIDLDVESRALVAALPEGTPYLEPEGLAHFDFLGLCTEQGLAILQEEEPEDAMVCEEGAEERRAEHAMIAQAVMAFFDAR